ncbi:unnamed protein product [Linum trigynum]|uniref:GDSL esterase/lipase n=1 Tax=Linum trigynum TaxID=586398 RepID=A0AAV2DH75_9ROSI
MKLHPLPTILFFVVILSNNYGFGSPDDPIEPSYYTSLFIFGDSAAAAGVDFAPGNFVSNCLFPPYGETYFHHPTGRCSDGRVIADFIAQHLLGLPLLPAYSGDPINNITTLSRGANLAVASATALDHEFLEARGSSTCQNCSLSVQLHRFKTLLNSLCSDPWNCRDKLRHSLFLVGEIGGVDYLGSNRAGLPSGEIEDLIPFVVDRIGSAVEELIELGAVSFLVPGDYPTGCFPWILTRFRSSSRSDYDPVTGCLVYHNRFSDRHNRMLRDEIERVGKLHPSASIHYAGYFESAIRIHENPEEFGFERATINRACCGSGGPYNYEPSAGCGEAGAVACERPGSYVKWDDHHYTEAANRVIAGDVIARHRLGGFGSRAKREARELPLAAE